MPTSTTPTWTLNGIRVDEFESVTMRVQNQSKGTLTIVRASNGDAPALFPAGADVALRDAAGVVRWQGKVSAPRSARESGVQRRQTLVANDAWGLAERTEFLMDYPFDDAPGIKDTRVLIGGKWQRVNITDPRDAVLGAYETVVDIVPTDIKLTLEAALATAGLSGNVGLGGIIPPQEADGVTVAQVIRTACELFPGAVAAPNATGGIDIRKASAMSPIAFDVADLVDWNITETPELQLPGAALHCRKTKQSQVGAKETLTIYTAGAPSQPGGVRVPLSLLPEVHSLDAGWLQIGKFSDVKPQDLAWWADYVPWVKTVLDGDTDLVQIDGVINPEIVIPDGTFLEEDITNVVLHGAILDSWLLFGCVGPFARREPLVTVDPAKLKIPKVIRISATATLIVRRKADATSALATVTQETVSAPLLLTNLTDTGRYAWEDAVALDPGEDPAVFADLPRQIWEESQRLIAEGSITLRSAAELPAGIIGHALNLTGLDPAWAEMRAPIHAVEQNVHTRETRIEFGQAKYLSLGTLAARLRAIKHKRPIRRRSTRYGLPPSSTYASDGGQAAPSPGDPGMPPAPPPAGRLHVKITPEEAVSAGAKWSAVLEGGASQGPFDSEEEAPVPFGSYTIHFLNCTGFKAPAKITGQVVSSGALTNVPEASCKYKPVDSTSGAAGFRLETREKADSDPESPTYEARVTNGNLYQGDLPTAITVTGMGTWVTLTSFPCDYWLKVDLDVDGLPTAAEIFHTGGGDTFDRAAAAYETGSAYEQDTTDPTHPYPQTLLRKFIGTLTQDAPNTLPLVSSQAFTGDLTLLWDVIAGYPAQTPYQR